MSSLCVDCAGELESCGFCSLGPAFQPVTPELADVLWPVSCVGHGIDLLRSVVAMCDCKGLGWEVVFPKSFQKGEVQVRLLTHGRQGG